MKLQEIVNQLEAVKKAMSSVKEAHRSIDAASSSIAKHYEEMQGHAKKLASAASSFLPSSFVRGLKKVEQSYIERRRILSSESSIYTAYAAALGKKEKILVDLKKKEYEYQTLVNRASKDQLEDAEILGDLWRELEVARAKGNEAEAEALKAQFDEVERNTTARARGLLDLYKKSEDLKVKLAEVSKEVESTAKSWSKVSSAAKQVGGKTDRFISGLSKAKDLTKEIFSDLKKWVAVLGVASLLKSFSKINEHLSDANSALAVRVDLAKTNYLVSLQTGATYDEIAESQQAILESGLKSLAADTSRVKQVTMLSVGLKIAVKQAAQLLKYSTLIGADFKDVGNAIAVATNLSKITANEVADIADEAARINHQFGNLNADLPGIVTALSEMQGQLKAFGAQDAVVQKLMGRFSTLQGLGDAVLFGGSKGILDPKSFESADAMLEMVRRTGDQLNRMTGGDPLKLAAFMPMLERMGLSMNDAQALLKMSKPGEFAKVAANIREAEKARKNTLALETRYMEHQTALGRQWDMLTQKGGALVKMALIPLLEVLTWGLTGINKVLSFVSDGIESIEKSSSTAATTIKTLGTAISWAASAAVAGILSIVALKSGKRIFDIVSAVSNLKTSGPLTFLRSLPQVAARSFSALSSVVARGIASMGGFLSKSIAFIARGGVSQFFTRILPGLGGLVTKIPWGAIASKVALPIAAAWGAFKVGQLGIEVSKYYKAKGQEEKAKSGLAESQDRMRKKYGLSKDVDPIEHVRKLNRQRWAAEAAAAAASAEKPLDAKIIPNPAIPAQPTYQRRIEPDNNAVPVAYRESNQSDEKLNAAFQALLSELKAIKAAVSNGAEAQIKGFSESVKKLKSDEGLLSENESMRKPADLTFA